ncbi:MAG TPA: hypothetical protein VNR42_05855 [Solirubrobacteraceae bacterium]|nr:hypothetical protein [Solirubrobacteraceae bacterium]
MSFRPTPSSPAPRTSRVRFALAAAAALATFAFVAGAGAMTSHAGWPPDQHLVMDKGPAGRHNTLKGKPNLHNYLLGGYGNDTIYGGEAGDVIWGDYHPTGWPKHQTAVIHAGNGKNFIYSNDTVNYVWTGTNRATVVHAHEGSGVIHCENPHIVVYTSHHALPHYKLRGCRRISFYSVGY